MTRIFTDGAEMGDTLFWDYNNPVTPIVAVSSPTPVGGDYSYRGAYLSAHKLVGSSVSEFYLRYRLRTSSPSQSVGASMVGWRDGDDLVGRLSIEELYRFCVTYGSTNVATSSIVMQSDTWYLIEIHVLLADTVGRIEVFIDGVQYINYTGTTNYRDTVDNIYFNSSAYTLIYLDDLAMNDTSGVEDNSWCGDGMIVRMIPNGDGTVNDWDGSDGNKVDNYLLVDEFPKDDDTTYVYCNGEDTGTQEKYSLTDLDYTNRTVLRIYPEARIRKSAATYYPIKLGILPSGGTDELSANRDTFAGFYSRVIGNEYKTNPVTAAEWVEADLDSLQFVAEMG